MQKLFHVKQLQGGSTTRPAGSSLQCYAALNKFAFGGIRGSCPSATPKETSANLSWLVRTIKYGVYITSSTVIPTVIKMHFCR